jgi:hypothetical protein
LAEIFETGIAAANLELEDHQNSMKDCDNQLSWQRFQKNFHLKQATTGEPDL